MTTARGLHQSKLFYFFFFAAAASLLPYVVLYYQRLGLSGRQIGLLTSLPPLVSWISAPLWGGFSDATRQHKRLLLLAIAGVSLVVATISTVTAFRWLIPLVISYAFFVAPILPLVDNTVMDLLAGREQDYGRQRLWGAVGWGLSAPAAGYLTERLGLHWMFYGYLILMAGLFVTAWGMPIQPASIGARFRDGMKDLLANRQWALFLAVVFVGGMGLSVVSNYLFLLMDELGAGGTLMGLSLTVATLGELAIFFYSDRLLSRWGPRRLLSIALASYVLRVLIYSLAASPWPVVLAQLLHGPAFAAMWVAGVSYADKLAPPGLGATAQGLFSGMMMGLGAAAGALLGGTLYGSIGLALMFRWSGVAVGVALILFMFAGRNGKRERFTP